MGYRIELGEIESVAMGIALIECACVMYDGAAAQIVMFYKTPSEGLAEDGIRRELATFIPKYMLPSRFVRLNDFPLNANGKIDRLKLREQYI